MLDSFILFVSVFGLLWCLWILGDGILFSLGMICLVFLNSPGKLQKFLAICVGLPYSFVYCYKRMFQENTQMVESVQMGEWIFTTPFSIRKVQEEHDI